MTTPTPEPLLTTAEVAELLQVNSKRIYRLVREGLPGRRVGGEWRFVQREVMTWIARGGSEAAALREPASPATEAKSSTANDESAPFVAANGDVAIEHLLALVNAARPVLGFVQADREQATRLLAARAVLAAGSHGKGPPARLGATRLARVHLVRREVGLAYAPGRKAPKLSELVRLRFAARPATAGVIAHLERAARDARVDVTRLLARATRLDSHRDVVCAVARGEADVGLATSAWARRVGLAFHALAVESYGLLVRAVDLGDPRVVHLCEVAQSARYRGLLASVPGYDATDAGVIRYDDEAAPSTVP